MATKSFDFKVYNELMLNANAGLKIVLAERLLLDVGSSFVRFENPLAPDTILAHQAVKLINEKSKEASALYRAKRDKDQTSDEIDNPVSNAANSADGGRVDSGRLHGEATEKPLTK